MYSRAARHIFYSGFTTPDLSRGARFHLASLSRYNARMNGESAVAETWGIIGHDWAVELLRRSWLHGRQRHAYLITGAPSLGKRALALAFAKALNCEDEDIAERPCGLCRACRAISRGNDPDLIVAKGKRARL